MWTFAAVETFWEDIRFGSRMLIKDFGVGPEGFEGITPLSMQAYLPHAIYTVVSSDSFKTMGIPLLRGRDVNDADDQNTQRVAVINEAMAKHFWAKHDPIGKRFVRTSDPKHPMEIVGVAGNSRIAEISGPFEEAFYVSYTQSYLSSETLQVLAATMPVSGIRSMSRAVRGINGLLLFEVAAGLAGTLGFLGLVLAVVGVYGVMSYAVSRRTSEIGIRMAMGAQPGQVLGMICRQGAVVVALGLMTGLAMALGIGRLLGDFLVGVTPNDPITYFGVSALLAGGGAAARIMRTVGWVKSPFGGIV